MTADAWGGRSVFITGHTGFKGGWLTLWLGSRGARVSGYSLEPPTRPSLHESARVSRVLARDERGDVRDLEKLRAAIGAVEPEVVFHLAAQAVVRTGYADPLGTYSTNVMGTACLLEAVRSVASVRAVVVVTSDKCYDETEPGRPHVESDALGGADPYSASKACAEIVAAAARASCTGNTPLIATVRAGNVVGGGDWAVDRLVPDCVRAFVDRKPVELRNAGATRPWQHVLEPLCGYLMVAERLLGEGGESAARAWNFGPDPGTETTVLEVARALAASWEPMGEVVSRPTSGQRPETPVLRLDSGQARLRLGWRPRWDASQMVAATVEWYRAWQANADLHALTLAQIDRYVWSEPTGAA